MQQLTQNQSTLRYLVASGYALPNIRKAIAILISQKHEEIGQRIGKSRSAVTNALDMGLGSVETLKSIARIMDIPVNELFADSKRYGAS